MISVLSGLNGTSYFFDHISISFKSWAITSFWKFKSELKEYRRNWKSFCP
jgi:hypothetical protein